MFVAGNLKTRAGYPLSRNLSTAHGIKILSGADGESMYTIMVYVISFALVLTLGAALFTASAILVVVEAAAKAVTQISWRAAQSFARAIVTFLPAPTAQQIARRHLAHPAEKHAFR